MSWDTEHLGSFAEATSLLAAFSVGPSAPPKSWTRANTTTQQAQLAAGSSGGLLLYGTTYYGNVSVTPDLASSITGLEKIYYTSNISTSIRALPLTLSVKSLSASLHPIYFSGLSASILSVPYSSLSASIGAIVSNISSRIVSVPPSDLSTFIDTHLPTNLSTAIFGIAGVNLGGFIRGTLGTNFDLQGTIQAVGYVDGISARIRSVVAQTTNLAATLMPVPSSFISASISGWGALSLGASIQHNYAAPDVRGIIIPYKTLVSDLGTFLRPGTGTSIAVSGLIRGWVSTHTGPEAPNVGRWILPFERNLFAVGTMGGLVMVKPEMVYGVFPDLAASIYCRSLTPISFGAVLRAQRASTLGLLGSSVGVTPQVNIARLSLNYVFLRSLKASLSSSGGFSGLGAIVVPWRSASTSTPPEAGFITKGSSTSSYVFSSAGLVLIPGSTIVNTSVYINPSPTPDLHAVLSGWASSDLGVSIRVYTQVALTASVRALDLSTIVPLGGSIIGMDFTGLSASIRAVGDYVGLGASVSSRGKAVSLGGSIRGVLGYLSREFISLHTKPFVGLGATINYSSSSFCSVFSSLSSLSALIRPKVGLTGNLGASIRSLRGKFDLGVSIDGLKSIKIRLLNLSYKTATRSSLGMRSYIVGWSRNNTLDLGVSIWGRPHEENLGASLQVVRLRMANAITAQDVVLVNLRTAEKITAEILFASGVSSYIYDSGDSKVYNKDTKEAWSVLVRSAETEDSFFDLPTNPARKVIAEMSDYDSFDEAIRNALDRLVTPPYQGLGASISASGAVASIGGILKVSSLDKVGNLAARIFQVVTMPDIRASISSRGSFSALTTIINPLAPRTGALAASLSGWASEELATSIVAVV